MIKMIFKNLLKSGILGLLSVLVQTLNSNAPLASELSDKHALASAGLVFRSNEMGCIYLVTNRTNGKQYVGRAKHGVNKRRKTHEKDTIKGSNRLFHKALRKYGIDNFDWDEVYSNVPDEDLNRLEIEAIKWYGSKVPGGYNLTSGGDGGDVISGMDVESLARYKINLSIAMKKVVKTPEYREKQKIVQTGRKHKDETKFKIREANLGRIFSEETIKKMSESAKKRGPRKQSVEERKNRSVNMMGNSCCSSAKARRAIAESNRRRIGEKRSAETRQRMSLAGRGKHSMSEKQKAHLRQINTGKYVSLETRSRIGERTSARKGVWDYHHNEKTLALLREAAKNRSPEISARIGKASGATRLGKKRGPYKNRKFNV